MALELGISQTKLSKIENGVESLTLHMLSTIASFFNISIDELISKTSEHNIREKEKILPLYEKRLDELEAKVKRKDKKLDKLVIENDILRNKLKQLTDDERRKNTGGEVYPSTFTLGLSQLSTLSYRS